MDIERKDLIVDEIKYWKQTKLLPEHYCDFLIMLYTEGEGVEEQDAVQKQQGRSIGLYIDLIFLLLFIPVSLFLTLSMDASIVFHVTSVAVILFITVMHYIFFRKKQLIWIHLPVILFFIILFLGSIVIFEPYLNTVMISGLILLNCLTWILFGYWKKYVYLTVSGAIGIILLVGYLIVI
ncbi:hypothetical protein [Aquisalibacillus elongatus]|uniref:Uncharacterized protein n=1 Tax=Aquisalibacillus elongatus TaxID=485577 RepID=A0A3N5BD06_9BACI|nr:hypothetical protein [Aquisalibacillus elongatus]RPF55606.1 hypothetical protein EDC24_0484 [Aquisalibacillus elongatus]